MSIMGGIITGLQMGHNGATKRPDTDGLIDK